MNDQHKNELKHYGVLGQKWGIRRYQPYSVKPRGSGKGGQEIGLARRVGRRVGRAITDPIKTRIVRRIESKENEKAIKDRKQTIDDMRLLSDAEIQTRINRLKNEQELKRLTEQDIAPGKKFVGGVMSDVSKRVLTTALTGAAIYGAKYLVDHEFDLSDFAKSVYRGGASKK